jgi:hypothetical protein
MGTGARGQSLGQNVWQKKNRGQWRIIRPSPFTVERLLLDGRTFVDHPKEGKVGLGRLQILANKRENETPRAVRSYVQANY